MFQCSSWVLPHWWSFSLAALVQLVAVLEEPKVRDLRHQYRGHAFLWQVPSLMLAAQVVGHPYLHLHPCLVHELDMQVFDLTLQRLRVLLGSPGCSRDLVVGRYARLVKSNTVCPIVEYSAGEEYRPNAGHVSLSHVGSISMVVPKFFHLRERKQDGHITCLCEQ